MFCLVVLFQTSAGKIHKWQFKDVDPTKTANEYQRLLEKMTTLGLFEKNGERLFDTVLSATLVQTIETSIFDLTDKESESISEVSKEMLIQAQEITIIERIRELKIVEQIKQYLLAKQEFYWNTS
ncbi:DUF2922 family protein [Enterococcus hermanniensis]|uniref:Uncharacterized protein n=1 Tax=Enterococcus hermanniensis TaxID=249189 RepID=A0A1L8TR79_9ENTE|nr:hypothetical protein [Enterococcus hermanniensis]OJG46816.1 hypothetical protein RV04_GL000063 [Enterococcus hermanniensis]